MTNQEYEEYLKMLDEEYMNFMNIAKKIRPDDLSDEMESARSKSVLAHIKLRATLQKFRRSSCGCNGENNGS